MKHSTSIILFIGTVIFLKSPTLPGFWPLFAVLLAKVCLSFTALQICNHFRIMIEERKELLD